MILGEIFNFILKISVANNFRFFWWIVNELSFINKAETLDWMSWYEGPFHGCGWLVKTSTMTHPDHWTIIKLWSGKRVHENAAFL